MAQFNFRLQEEKESSFQKVAPHLLIPKHPLGVNIRFSVSVFLTYSTFAAFVLFFSLLDITFPSLDIISYTLPNHKCFKPLTATFIWFPLTVFTAKGEFLLNLSMTLFALSLIWKLNDFSTLLLRIFCLSTSKLICSLIHLLTKLTILNCSTN